MCVRLVDEAIAQVEQLVQADAKPVFEQHAIAVFFFNLVRHGDGARLVEVVRRNGNGIFHFHEDEHGTPQPGPYAGGAEAGPERWAERPKGYRTPSAPCSCPAAYGTIRAFSAHAVRYRFAFFCSDAWLRKKWTLPPSRMARWGPLHGARDGASAQGWCCEQLCLARVSAAPRHASFPTSSTTVFAPWPAGLGRRRRGCTMLHDHENVIQRSLQALFRQPHARALSFAAIDVSWTEANQSITVCAIVRACVRVCVFLSLCVYV